MFMKEKRYGTSKVRGVVDGRKKREKIEPKDATLPTVSTEAAMLTTEIDSLEGRDGAVVDIPGVYLIAKIDNDVHIVFRGTLAELMVAAKPLLYQPFVLYTTGQAVLYARPKKALFGCLKSAFLFNDKLVGYLEASVFKIDTYDPCVANNMVGGKHISVF